MTKKRGILAAVLAAFFLLGSGVPAQAMDRHGKCEHRIRQAEANLDKAIRKHGERSRQAEHRRRELYEARERCRHRDHDRR
jgi:hypothetical protein